MSFPLDNPIFNFLYWLIDTATVGGIAVLMVGGGSVLAYALTLRWISQGAQVDDPTTYTFPTASLLGHGSGDSPGDDSH